MITQFLLSLYLAATPATIGKPPEAPKLTEADQLRYFQIRARFAEAELTKANAKAQFDAAQKAGETVRTEYLEWVKAHCEPVEAADHSLTCPAPAPPVAAAPATVPPQQR